MCMDLAARISQHDDGYGTTEKEAGNTKTDQKSKYKKRTSLALVTDSKRVTVSQAGNKIGSP